MFFFRKSYPSQFKQEVERLTHDLVQIGLKEDYLSERSGGPFDQNCRNIRAREIGNRFYEIGGTRLMEDIMKKISKKIGKDGLSHLEACWRLIGGEF